MRHDIVLHSCRQNDSWLLDVGCKRPEVTVAVSGSVRTVTVAGQTVTLN